MQGGKKKIDFDEVANYCDQVGGQATDEQAKNAKWDQCV
jgi:hypothetical protein